MILKQCKLTWSKNDEPLLASTRFTTNYEPNTGEIDVSIEFVKSIDTGTYKCKAENEYGADETFVTIIIIDVPNIDERPQTVNPDAFKHFDSPAYQPDNIAHGELNLQPPIVIIPLKDLVIREEQNVCLTCKIIGNPKPKVQYLC